MFAASQDSFVFQDKWVGDQKLNLRFQCGFQKCIGCACLAANGGHKNGCVEYDSHP